MGRLTDSAEFITGGQLVKTCDFCCAIFAIQLLGGPRLPFVSQTDRDLPNWIVEADAGRTSSNCNIEITRPSLRTIGFELAHRNAASSASHTGGVTFM